MTEPKKPAKKSASPYSTGGGGVRFEHRVGAVFLARLLTQSAVSELGERIATSVAFQQAPRTTVDDLVVCADMGEGEPRVRLEIAVRRRPNFVRSHDDTQSLIRGLVKADLAAERSPDPLGEVRLGVSISGQQAQASEVAELAAVARNQRSANEFFELVRTPGKFASKGRLEQLLGMVSSAMTELAEPVVAIPEYRCWRLLQRLSIIALDVELGHDDDWTALVDQLEPLAHDHSSDAAWGLREQLDHLAGEFAQTAGVIELPMLRRRLHGAIDPGAFSPPPGWERLKSLDREARAAVSRSLTVSGSADSLTLTRRAAREALSSAIKAEGDLVVKGDSGVGKSALVMDAIAPDALGLKTDAIAINLRHLPDNNLALVSQLRSPVEDVLAWLTAPVRILVIDGAEASAESRSEVFSSLLRSARQAGYKVVVVAATEGAGVATELAARGSEPPREHAVPGLTDEDIASLAEEIPALRRLAENARARELLRRPIVVDLLLRIGDPGLPLNEAEALAQIWRQLVRNGERQDSGASDAREQAMLRLAAHAIRGGDTEDLLGRLDNAAIEGLRQHGLLLPAGDLPWQRIPEFKHDLLRFYSLARYLLEERDPVAALTSVGAPRWALPSARLACQILLAAPDDESHARVGRFSRIQQSFDKLVSEGFGQRWADVPAEALITSQDSEFYLADSWNLLSDDGAAGLTRLFRVLRARHRPGGIVDIHLAEPLVVLLVGKSFDQRTSEAAADLRREWLQAHVLRGTPVGHPTRIAIREEILTECANKEAAAERERVAKQFALAARTPEQIAADEERLKKFAGFASVFPDRARPKPEPARPQSYLWIRDIQIEQLALLGADLSPAGEGILRRIAEDEPHSLHPAIEPVLTGMGLASYDPSLLIELSAAYYIEDDEEDEGFGFRVGPGEDGIRDHRTRRGSFAPLSRFTYGPFIALLRGNYREGVAFLNRMMNHAARQRVRILSGLRSETPRPESEDQMTHSLALTGEERRYVGDGHVWLWYRGTGVGPYPCQSALQALEFVTEELVEAGVQIPTLVSILLDGAENLAVPGLTLAVIIRHLEKAGSAIDPFLVEPLVWHLEFNRAINEQLGLASRVPELPKSERRRWSLREVSMVLTLKADAERTAQLKAAGEQLQARAAAEVDEASSPEGQHTLALAKQWAAALDRDAYKVSEQDGNLLVEVTVDEETKQVLGSVSEELRNDQDAMELSVRHSHPRNKGGAAPELDRDQLAFDLATARRIVDEPRGARIGPFAGAAAAVAASVLELHLSGRSQANEDDLAWSAELLLRIAAEFIDQPEAEFFGSLSSHGPGRSAGRALPYLLLPAAKALRGRLSEDDPVVIDELVKRTRAIASNGPLEARLAFAQGLDVVWRTPCDESQLHGRCHHRVAYEFAQESFAESAIGPWDPDLKRRTRLRLDPCTAEALAGVKPENILVSELTPAIRAFGAAAAHASCVADQARASLTSLVSAHQRGTLAHENGYHQSHSDALVVARAVLQQAAAGAEDSVLHYVKGYLGNSRVLSEALRAVAAAGEESAIAGNRAQRLWPQLMDLVLDASEQDPRILTEQTWGEYVVASLLPTATADGAYMTVEVQTPIRWCRPLKWTPQVDRWIATVPGTRKALDQLVIAVQELDIQEQATTGLDWIERLVSKSGGRCAGTFTLPEWLHKRRPDLKTKEQIDQWQRIVDQLVVAGDTRVSDLVD